MSGVEFLATVDGPQNIRVMSGIEFLATVDGPQNIPVMASQQEDTDATEQTADQV